MKKFLMLLSILMLCFISVGISREVTVTNDNGYFSYNGWVDNEGLTINFEKPPRYYFLVNDGDTTNSNARLYYGFEPTFTTSNDFKLSGEWFEDEKNVSYVLYLEASDGDNDTFRLRGKE